MIPNSHKIRLTIRLMIAGATLCVAGSAAAATFSAKDWAQYSKLPNWSGVWVLEDAAAFLIDPQPTGPTAPPDGARAHPPYNAEWEAKYVANLDAADENVAGKRDPIIDTYTVYCETGMPRVMVTPFEYQFINTPGVSWIISGGEVRQIYTDGRKRPDDDTIWPKMYGWSTGQWHGDTLEVETTNVMPGLWADGTPILFSEQVKFTERFRMINANTIQDDMVITDPVSLTRPWKLSRQFVRINLDWVDEKEFCGGSNDRHPIVNGNVTTTKPKK